MGGRGASTTSLAVGSGALGWPCQLPALDARCTGWGCLGVWKEQPRQGQGLGVRTGLAEVWRGELDGQEGVPLCKAPMEVAFSTAPT